MIRLARTSAVCVVAALVCSAAPAAGDPLPSVRLAVVRTNGAESCVTTEDLARDVTRRLGRDPFDPRAERSVEVVLARSGATWTATVYLRSGVQLAGTRALASDAPTCARLGDTLGLSVALAIDPTAALASEADRPTVPPVVAAPPAGPACRRARADEWDRTERLTARVALLIGPLPAPTLAFALGMDTGRAWLFRGSFGVLRSLEATTPDGAFGFTLTEFWAALCIAGATGRVGGGVCAAVRAGAVNGVVRTHTLEPARPGDYGWLALGLAASGTLRLVDPLVLEAVAEPFVPLVRQRFRFEGGADIFAQSPVGVTVSLGVRARFW